MYKTKYVLVAALVLSSILFILGGCTNSPEQPLDFSRLISQADKYNGQSVTLEAYYFGGFEISALCGTVGPATSGEWRIVPSGTLVWVKGGIPQDLLVRLYKQTVTPSGYTENIGRLLITGKFETGNKYGHLDAYSYEITITKAEMLEWSPPPAAVVPTTSAPEITVSGPK
jgi:hypothetical protein